MLVSGDGRRTEQQEVLLMPAIVAIPRIIAEVVPFFADLFANEPQRQHMAEYLTGLVVARGKTVNAMHNEFAVTTDQSCWNRFLTEANWDVQAFNERRLAWLQQEPSTRYDEQGVIAVDDVLIDHDGKLIADVGWYWDHAEDRYKIAHDYLFANYVCRSGKHYPLEFRLFKKREQCEVEGETFHDHGILFRDLVDWVDRQDIPGDFTFDSYFCSPGNLNHIHSKTDRSGRPRGYVGDSKMNRKIWYRGREIKADDLAASIEPLSRRPLRRGDVRQWYFTCTVHIPGVNHKVRIVILWKRRRDKTARKILVTNRITWEIQRILSVYRHRWTGTETFHRDGKQELGMGDCQLRDGQGQTRHMYLVMLAYSVLMRQLKHSCAKEWAYRRLTTIGEACRAVLGETLRTTLEWAVQQVVQHPDKARHIPALLGLT
jgi:hypothetical protein